MREVRKILLVALALVLAICGAAFAADPVPQLWRVSMTLPDGHPANDMANVFGKILLGKSKRALTAKAFGSDQLGNTIASIEGIQMGTIEAGNIPAGPVAQFVPSWEVFSLPYIFKDEAHMFAALDGDFGKALAADLLEHDLVLLGWVNSGSRNVITNKRNVNVPEDMKGLKIRVMDSKLMVDTLNAMGGIATPMAQSEVYSALQQGVIDGWENNPTTLYALKLYEVSKFFSWTRHFMTPDVLVVSKMLFDKLTPELQKAVREAGAEATMTHRRVIWPEYINSVLDKLKAEGVQFAEASGVEAFMKATQPVKDAYIKKHGTKYLDMIPAAK